MNLKCFNHLNNNARPGKNVLFFINNIVFFSYKTFRKMINSIYEVTYLKRGGERCGDPWLCDEQCFSEVHPLVSPSPLQQNHNLSNIHTCPEESAKKPWLEWYRQTLRPLSGASIKVRPFLSCLHNNESVRERILLPSSVRVSGTTHPLLLWLETKPLLLWSCNSDDRAPFAPRKLLDPWYFSLGRVFSIWCWHVLLAARSTGLILYVTSCL